MSQGMCEVGRLYFCIELSWDIFGGAVLHVCGALPIGSLSKRSQAVPTSGSNHVSQSY